MLSADKIKANAMRDYIKLLKAQLAQDDYKIIKCAEAKLNNLPMPYDVAALHAARQEIRNQINILEMELNAD